MPKKSRAQEAALGQNLEPLLVLCGTWIQRTMPRGNTKRMSSVDAHKWVDDVRNISATAGGWGWDRMFIDMRETLDYAIGIVLRRLTAIQGMTDVGLDLRVNANSNADRKWGMPSCVPPPKCPPHVNQLSPCVYCEYFENTEEAGNLAIATPRSDFLKIRGL
ncbi:hypothetical protein B0H13DRAFT_1857069 [Mycena leptocephala]|nr:hypothetical protein B0H13DRAFT_1857069 [Mycena leptocephala]